MHNDDPLKMYYLIFGLNSTASFDEVKAKYREKVQHYHPDKNQDKDAETQKILEDQMKALNEAYDYLKNIYETKQGATETEPPPSSPPPPPSSPPPPQEQLKHVVAIRLAQQAKTLGIVSMVAFFIIPSIGTIISLICCIIGFYKAKNAKKMAPDISDLSTIKSAYLINNIMRWIFIVCLIGTVIISIVLIYFYLIGELVI